MAEQTESVNWFDIKTAEEALQVIEDMRRQFLYLGKTIKIFFIDFRDYLSQRMLTRIRNDILSVFDAFDVDSMADYAKASSIYGSALATSLYQVQLGLGQFKTAIVQAVAPMVQVFLPVVHTAIYLLTGLAQAVGRVLRFLFLGTTEVEDYASGMQSASVSANKLKKTLAGFDQINRLNGREGGVSGVVSGLNGLKPMSGSLSALASKLDKLLEPFKKLDLAPAAESLERFREALQPITKALFEGLEWAWYNLLVPLGQWAVEELLPVFLDMLTTSLQTLGRIVEELKPYLSWLWEEYLKPLAQWKGNQIIAYIQGITTELGGMSGWISTNKSPVEDFIYSIKLLLKTFGEMADNTMKFSDASDDASSAISALLNIFLQSNTSFEGSAGLFGTIATAVLQLATAFDMVTDSSDGAWVAMKNVWENGWTNLKQKFTDPAYAGVKQSMNSTIDLMNTMLYTTTRGVNHLGSAMNALSFTVPNWVPGLGGKNFSFSIRTLRAPQIPYLAKGAVLPANKPFMAVVGDQKHGTNVEAPLTVIQEAVATVMEDYAASNMAGHQATVSVLQELLEAVLGIQIGDDVIASAAARYERKMAVVRGGYL